MPMGVNRERKEKMEVKRKNEKVNQWGKQRRERKEGSEKEE